jgi:hypothetical protein
VLDEKAHALRSMLASAIPHQRESLNGPEADGPLQVLGNVSARDAREALYSLLEEPGGYSPEKWAEVAQVVASMRKHGLSATPTPARRAAFTLVEFATNFALEGFSPQVRQEALRTLYQRVDESSGTNLVLRRRAPRWRKPPSPSIVGAPVLAASEVELAVAALLSETQPEWQFSSTPEGRMFSGSRKGYHREFERTYLEGLSDVVDTAALVVEQHRGGVGGRVFLLQDRLRCAECRLTIAWIGREGTTTTAFGVCPSPKRRRS